MPGARKRSRPSLRCSSVAKRSTRKARNELRLLARGASLRPAHGAHRAARSAAAEELIAAVRFEPRHDGAGRQIELLQRLSAARVDMHERALVAFPGAVPELVVDPGHAGDEALRLDRAQDRACRGIDLADLARAVLPDPQRAFGPGKARDAAGGRRDRAEHAAAFGIDLLDTVLGD